jgi:hypothetical protein
MGPPIIKTTFFCVTFIRFEKIFSFAVKEFCQNGVTALQVVNNECR